MSEDTKSVEPVAPGSAWPWVTRVIACVTDNAVMLVVAALLIYRCTSGVSGSDIDSCAAACGAAGVHEVNYDACICRDSPQTAD